MTRSATRIERMLVITKDGHTDPALDAQPGVMQLRERASRARSAQLAAMAPSSNASVDSLREDVLAAVPRFRGGSSSLVEALRDGVSLGEVLALNVQRTRQRLGHRDAERRARAGSRASRAVASRACSRDAVRSRCSSRTCPETIRT